MSSSLTATADVLPPKPSHLKRTPCPHAAPSPCDCYDQRPGRYACVDSTGRKRRRHEYLLETRRGSCCVWCGALNRMVRLD